MAKSFVNKLPYEDIRIGKKLKNAVGFISKRNAVKPSLVKVWRMHSFAKKRAIKASGASKNWEQRSIAKVSYVKNFYSGQWKVQGRYLARQGAQLADGQGLGFNGENEDLNIAKTLNGWQEEKDPRLWKVILSPEMAHKLDLKEHVRIVMVQVQKDLGTKLEWLAIDHYNTDNPHAHIVFRGLDKKGQELKIKQEYFTEGFRLRSSQEATRVLGFRLEQDVLLKREHNIRSLHVTELDREIKRRLTKDQFINLNCDRKDAFGYEKELQLRSRLMYLEELGLVKRDSTVSWIVDPGFIDYLKFVQTQHDIIKVKNKHIHNISNPNFPVVVNKLENVGDKVIGRIIGMGFDEFKSEARYMLIEGIDNKIHYVPASVGMSHKRDDGALRNGEIIHLERKKFIKQKPGQWGQEVNCVVAESFSSIEEMQHKQLSRSLGLRLERGEG